MTQKPDKSKRRPPGEAPNDGQQDADWGFDAGDGNPTIEKKLGVALVVCLLLGFGFVFFQKYRLLQNEKASVQTNDGAKGEQGDKSVVQETTSVASEAEPTADDSPRLTTTLPLEKASAESPFFEPTTTSSASAPQAEPSSTETAGWTLTQAESPASPFADSAEESLPPQPEEPASDGFDPFLNPVESEPSAAPQATSTPNESVAVTWGEEAPAAQFEPPTEPSASLTSPTTASSPTLSTTPTSPADPDPFLSDVPNRPDSPTPAAPTETSDETPTFVFEEATEPAEPAPSGGTDASTLRFDPLPPQDEPQPLESPAPEPLAAEASPSLSPLPSSEDRLDAVPFAESPPRELPAESTTSQDGFAPFPSADPPAPEKAVAPQQFDDPPAEKEPFGYLAPPVRDDPALARTPAEKPAPNAVVEPPAWPFADSADGKPSHSTATTSPQAAAPRATPSPFDPPSPQDMPGAAESASTTDAPPNPFSFDAVDSRPIAESVVPGHAAIGEREIVVAPSDSFWSISEREYGSARYFNALAKYNRDRVDAPDKLRSGMRIKIPPPEVLEDKHPELFRSSAVPQAVISPLSGSSVAGDATPPAGLFLDERQQPRYRVGERETLSSIAQQVLGRSSRWTEVYDLNRDQLKSPSTLKIGTVLKLPSDAGRVTVSPAGGFVR